MATPTDTARPRFFVDAVPNPHTSKQEGRPMFDDCELVEVRIPGDKHLVHVAPVEAKHRERWPDIYAAFKRGEDRAASGTPLEHWAHPTMTRSRVRELKAGNILSVEELSTIPDSALSRLGAGARAEREAAKAYLEAARVGAPNAAQAIEIAELRTMVEKLLAAAVPVAAPVEPVQPAERAIGDATDDELKAFIASKLGERPRGRISRPVLEARAAELAEAA